MFYYNINNRRMFSQKIFQLILLKLSLNYIVIKEILEIIIIFHNIFYIKIQLI